MSNWCQQNLIISGSESDIAKVKTTIFKKLDQPNDMRFDYEFDFNGVIPIPHELQESDLNLFWKLNNWRTGNAKYTNGYEIDSSETEINIFYETANCPATPIIYELIEMFPDCEIIYHYYEPGMYFAGFIISTSGQPTMSGDFSGTDEAFKVKKIGVEIFEDCDADDEDEL